MAIGATKQTRHFIVSAVLMGLFIATLGQVVIQWYYTNISFRGKAQNRLQMLYLSQGGASSTVSAILNVTLLGICQILADALLVNFNLHHYMTHCKRLIKHADMAWLASFISAKTS